MVSGPRNVRGRWRYSGDDDDIGVNGDNGGDDSEKVKFVMEEDAPPVGIPPPPPSRPCPWDEATLAL